MNATRQNRLLAQAIENAPSVVFFVTLYGLDDIRTAGWLGCVAAIAVLAACAARRIPANPILLGINLYMAAITPAAEVVHLFGWTPAAMAIAENGLSLVLVAIFFVGCALTLFARRGFIGVACATRRETRIRSFPLLCASFAAATWSQVVEADRMVQIGAPLVLLFFAQHVLVARLLDRKDEAAKGVVPAASAGAGEDFELGSAI